MKDKQKLPNVLNDGGKDGMKLINKWTHDRWKYGTNEWKIKENKETSSISIISVNPNSNGTGILGPEKEPGPGSLGLDPKGIYNRLLLTLYLSVSYLTWTWHFASLRGEISLNMDFFMFIVMEN